jgi:hypothetical protein
MSGPPPPRRRARRTEPPGFLDRLESSGALDPANHLTRYVNARWPLDARPVIWPSSSGSLSSAATIMSSKRPGSTSPTYDAHDSDFRR